MASSSRPFQSQTATRLVATYRRWTETTARTARQLRVGFVWAAQVALYPVYGLFQAGRLIYRQIAAADLGRHLRHWRRQLSQGHLDEASGLSSLESGATVAWLNWLQSFEMSVLPGPVLGRLESSAVLLEAADEGQLVVPQVTAPLVQGLATDLQTRSLVLVVAGNHLLDVLSAQEQDSLRRAIAYWLASQRYAQQRRTRQLTVGNLPLPVPNRRAWWPIQLFQQLMRWVGSGPVAQITNLFGEAQRGEAQRSQQKILSGTPTSPPWPLAQSAQPSIYPRFEEEGQPVAPMGLAKAQPQRPSQTYSATSVGLLPSKDLEGDPGGLVQEKNLLPQEAFPWIEAKAIVVSYVDHPLVRVLRWIDQGLLWLEMLAQQTWGWVRSHFTL